VSILLKPVTEKTRDVIPALMNANTAISWVRFQLHEAGTTGAGYFEEESGNIAEQAFTAGASTHHWDDPGWYLAADGTSDGDRYWKDTGGLMDNYCRIDDILDSGVLIISFFLNQDQLHNATEYLFSYGGNGVTDDYFYRLNLLSTNPIQVTLDLRVEGVQVAKATAVETTDFAYGDNTAFTYVIDCTTPGEITLNCYVDGVLADTANTTTLPTANTAPSQKFCLFDQNIAGTPGSAQFGSSGINGGGGSTISKISELTIIKSTTDIITDAVSFSQAQPKCRGDIPWTFT